MATPEERVEPLFRTPTAGEEPLYRFGDIVEAPWLVALYLRDDARRIQRIGPDRSGGEKMVLMPLGEPLPDNERNNLVLAHVEDLVAAHGLTRRGMILSDDCEIATRQREGRGRIRLAAVADLPTEPAQLNDVLTNVGAFDRMVVRETLEPNGMGFKIDFPMTFSLAAPDLQKTTVALRPASAAVRMTILAWWCAQSTRHGPKVAEDGVEKLAKLIEANGDPSEIKRLRQRREHPAGAFKQATDPLLEMLALAWSLEGPLLDRVSDDLEAGASPESVVGDLLPLVERIAEQADKAKKAIASLASAGRKP